MRLLAASAYDNEHNMARWIHRHPDRYTVAIPAPTLSRKPMKFGLTHKAERRDKLRKTAVSLIDRRVLRARTQGMRFKLNFAELKRYRGVHYDERWS